VSYGEPGFELADEDLEGLVTELERVLEEVQSMIADVEEAAEE
jgi:hypothetical protein